MNGGTSRHPEVNKIAGSVTRALGVVYPDSSLVFPVGDYSPIQFDLDENDNSLVLDFGADYGTGDARGATVRFRRRQLIVFIHMLQASRAGRCHISGVVQTRRPPP